MRPFVGGRGSSVRAILFLAVAFFGTPARAAVTPNLLRLVDSPAGRHVLFETDAGEALLGRLLGGVPAGDAVGALVGGLGASEMAGVSARLEECLSRIETRMVARRPDLAWTFQASGSLAEFRGEAQSLLEQLSAAELRIEPSFFPQRPFGDYDSTRKLLLRALEYGAEHGSPLVRYPVGVDPIARPADHLDFTFQASYSGDRLNKLLSVYGPESMTADGGAVWLSMRAQDRVAYVRAHSGALFPVRGNEGAFVLLRPVAEAPFLPKRLSLDWDGSLLLTPSRVDTLEQWMARARWLSAKLPPSRMTGGVGLPVEAFHSGVSSGERQARLAENAGYLFFSNDLETLESIESGATGFADPGHGPMTLARQRALVAALKAHAAGEPITQATLDFVRNDDSSFRMVGGTVYRPEIAPGLIHLEVRDEAGTIESLADRIVKTTFFLQFGRAPFRGAAGFAAFDPREAFLRLPQDVRAMLEAVYPTPIDAGVSYSEAERDARAVHRHFAWPLRDWSMQLRFLGREDLAPMVASARQRYIQGLSELAAARLQGRLSVEEIRLRVQAGLRRFVEESSLLEAYRDWLARNLSAERGWEDYMALTVRELGPLGSAYPLSNWEGSLDSRVARFLERWRGSAAVVDDVGFRFLPAGARPGQSIRSSRRVLVISTAGLSEPQIAAISRDYADAVSRGTISFPLAEAGGHLHARLGNADFDWWGRFTVKPYKASSWRRLEAVVSLSPVEELRLRTYIENVARNPWDVIGMPNYNGAASAATEGGLGRNMPRAPGEGHNCTSYLCTVKVGDQGERLFELVGADSSMEVHTNPGWWTHFLTGAAVDERVPMVVRWDGQAPLHELLAQIRSGEEFPDWDFALE